jgi:hypothetical protein
MLRADGKDQLLHFAGLHRLQVDHILINLFEFQISLWNGMRNSNQQMSNHDDDDDDDDDDDWQTIANRK